MPRPRPRRRIRPLRPTAAVLAAASLLVLIAGPARAGGHAGEADRHGLRARLQELVDNPQGPPGVIAVLRRGDHLDVYRAGVAQVGTDRPPRPTDHMRIASVAKAFSGAVALRLVDQGLLGLDDTIAERLPALPAAWGSVTLRQLLNHTSGLPDYTSDPEFVALLTADPHRLFDSRHLLDFVADRGLEFPPGTRYQYSNSDNIAVALMAEAVTGERYENLLRTEVYRPLRLRETSLPQGYRLPRPYLHGYLVDPPNQPEDISTALGQSGVWASGGIVSTPKDFSAFMAAYAGGDLITRQTRQEQLAFIDGASEPAGPGTNQAGLAIFKYTTRCGVVYGHTGNTPGYTQLGVGTPDGRRSLTFSISEQVSKTIKPDVLAQVRAVQEDFVCALLSDDDEPHER
ncbi:serine hydrolase domain-containing protein [Kitasatospora sp. NBC_00374]|uniref:serine hydrolase domain-containing protein n=1 Tax=Kitasatospora sp. NBC_00374 TaxID=2975964 RepID=UPI00352C6020